MDNQSVARECVHIRYKGTEAWSEALHCYTLRADDPEIEAGLIEGGGGVKDYMRNRFVLAFRGGVVINGTPYPYRSISVLVVNKTPFAVYRVGEMYLDASGRQLEVMRG